MRSAVVTIVSGRHDHLLRQLEGLAAGSIQPDHHIVVSMGDPAVGELVGASAEVVDLPTSGSALPLAKARNAGAARALTLGARLLVFLDVDCVPGRWLVARYRELAVDETLLCGPVTYLPPGRHRLDELPAMTRPHPGRPAPADATTIRRGDHQLFWSLSFALTAPTWRTIGGFSEDYVGYGGEDTDFGQLARRCDIELRWIGGAHAYHQHHPTQDPPVEHLDDILVNARLFHHRWGWWPMGGWLEQFADRGLVEFRDGEWRRAPAPGQIGVTR
jgi:GT2 family glycosyltransferase